MKPTGKNIFRSLLFIPIALILYSSSISGLNENNSGRQSNHGIAGVKDTIVEDTTKLIYPFKDSNDPYSRKKQSSPLYLKNPSNIQTEVEYDPITGEYILKEKIGDIEIRPSNSMSTSEYSNFTQSASISDYWVEQRRINSKSGNANESFLEKYLNPKLNVNIKGFDKIFGSNVIDIKPQGSAELIFGVSISKIENPTLPINLQRSTNFDFDMKIQMGVTGKIGDKMKVGINYNTEAQFDFENQTTLSYTGDEDEIIQSIEAGNVSLPLTGTLITGSQSLFGLKTALQFGKLKVTSIFSQQKSESSVIEVEGGAQTSDYQLKVDEYESNKHFFLSQYFKDSYDRALQSLPIINSGINITRIEVWVTNKSGNFENARNILGLMDLAENDKNIYSTDIVQQTGPGEYPYNDLNNLYGLISNNYSDIRNVNKINSAMPSELQPIIEYAKVENARLLSPNEYSLNAKLGYISLNAALNDDEVLAVAYEYTISGRNLVVGEFSNSGIESPQTLILKLIKGPALIPGIPTWELMMKNIYSIGSYQINSEDFKLDILYNDDKTGTTVNYIDAGAIAGIPLLKVMGLDQLNTQLDPQPDGYFDFIDKQTINVATGRIIFPVREPFGEHLRTKINDEIVADKYIYTALYDSSQSRARQIAEKNKFIIKGSYKSTGGSEINLNAFNIPEGSVKATANGIELAEGTDYIVDYNLGKVTILNQGLLEAGTPIRISLENNSMFNINRRTLLGTHLDYIFSDNFSLGGTILHLSEKPLTNKVNIGNEPISNTIWGVDGSYSTDVPMLTRIIDALPFLETKEMSSVEINGEFAQLIPGHSKAIGKNGNAYIDDFEGSKTSIDLKAQYTWVIASTPKGQPDLFPEGDLFDDLRNGYNRAKLAWYNVNTDLLRNTSVTPDHITADDQSNHYVREVPEQEIFPNKESITGYPTILNVANLAFYPDEKGPYNYDVDGAPGISAGIDPDGKLKAPETRWGGIMRQLQTNDFEASNIEFIEFWVMDPFIYGDKPGGDLYFNLGYISEDILKDGRKSFENGLPTTSGPGLVDTTNWGLVPLPQSLVNAFDNDPNARTYQDIGMDGLSDDSEAVFFKEYLDSLSGKISAAAHQKAIEDPSSDNYHFFRGSDYDALRASILDRYKNFNGLEGNSPTASQSPEDYPTSATLLPDIEDINLDNTLNEEETYFQYRISLRPGDLNIENEYITDVVTAYADLKNDKNDVPVKWYQFKIPIRKPDKKIGPISDFKSIRFMRLFMRDFTDTMILRFARLDLVRSEWRNYEGSVTEGYESVGNPQPSDNEGFDVSVISIEENGSREPINYVLPPGVTRVIDPTNPYLKQLNEQALVFRVTDLNDGDAKAAYKNIDIDIRQYKKLQMEVHTEALNENDNLRDDDLRAFIRLGSDYRQNYYEVEIPLKLTPWRSTNYNNEIDADRQAVWPEENRFDFELQLLQLVKQHRNNKMNMPGSAIQFSTAYYEYIDGMKITIVGDPNLSNLQNVMLGVRNPSKENNTTINDYGDTKSGLIWFNELRVTDFIEEGGWAANTSISAKLADFGSITVAGIRSTHGFGSIDKKVNERQKEDITSYDVSSNMELGKFFPQKSRVRIPLYFGFSENVKTPQYNPLDPDILMETTLSDPELSKEERSSLEKVVLDYTQRKSINFTNLKIEGDPLRLEGKKKRFYHISNFALSFAYSELNARNVKTEHNTQKSYAGSFGYVFNNRPKAFEPFSKVKLFQKKTFQIIKDFNFYLAPTMVSYRTDMLRKYQEVQLRDITQENSIIAPTYKKDFDWNRSFDIKYSITKALKFNFTANNRARIDEPYGAMDKNDPNYKYKKDTIWQNILKMGRDVKYNHAFDATYTIPINKLPLLRWTSATAMYKSTYEWGAAPISAVSNINIGNVIANSNSIQLNSTLTFSRLYDKVPFLKGINDKMKKGGKSDKKYKDIKFTKEKVKLKKNIAKSITHNLATEDVQISVKDSAGQEIKGELIVVNQNKVKFRADANHEGTLIEISGKKEIKDNLLRTLGEGTVYMLIGLKNASVSYNQINGTILPGYLPSTNFGGLTKQNEILAPGLPFVLGIQNTDFPKYASVNDWITTDSLQTSPYIMNSTVNYNIRATVEPLKGFKIDLTANRRQTNNNSEYWFADNQGVFSPHNRMYAGSFSISTVLINTSFAKFGENYSSTVYNKFKENRITIANRLASQRQAGMIPGVSPEYDPSQPNFIPDPERPGEYLNDGFPNGYGRSSQEVLLPALLAAYSGRSVEKVGLSSTPKFPLPNWSVTYDGLSEVDLVKRIVKNIILTHIYSASYNLGSFTTNPNYSYTDISADGQSWARFEDNGMFIPEQDINSISLIEEFKPLISADVTWINNFNSKIEINRSRSITLSFANNQIIDLADKELIIGLGYRFEKLPIIIKTGGGTKQTKFESDLNLRGDLAIADMVTVIRKIDRVDQISAGQKAFGLKLSADYALNERFNLKLFYDHAISTPKLSTSFRTSNVKFGVSVRFTLIP